MKDEEKEQLKRLRKKRQREVYLEKLEKELGVPGEVIENKSGMKDFDELSLQIKYKWYKKLIAEDFNYENNYVTVSKSGKIHFIRSWVVHHDYSDKWYGANQPYDEEMEGTVCGGDAPHSFDKRRVERVNFCKNKLCNSCLKAKRRRIAAINTMRKAGVDI